VFTGALITIITVAFLITISPYVRIAIFDIPKMQEEIKRLRNDMIIFEQERVKLLDEIAAMGKERQRLKEELNELRSEKLAFTVGEEISSETLFGEKSEREIEEELRLLQRKASEIAMERGAKSSLEDVYAVKISDLELATAAGEIKKSDEPITVKVVSKRNTLVDEPVLAYLELAPSKLVFEDNEEVVVGYVNGESSPEEIDRILKDLEERAQLLAERRGMRPNSINGGGLGTEEIEDIKRRIAKIGKRVEVAVVAPQDIYISDPLILKFEIRQ